MRKRKWKKPELIVLVRGKPEEAVLTYCKLISGPSANAETENTACMAYNEVYGCEKFCSTRGVS